MRRHGCLIFLLAFLSQAHAKELPVRNSEEFMDKLADKLVDKLFSQALTPTLRNSPVNRNFLPNSVFASPLVVLVLKGMGKLVDKFVDKMVDKLFGRFGKLLNPALETLAMPFKFNRKSSATPAILNAAPALPLIPGSSSELPAARSSFQVPLSPTYPSLAVRRQSVRAKAQPTYELTYWDIRGLAEITRWLFKVAKVDFKDNRIGFSFGTPGDFSTLKRPEYDAMLANGELDVSLGKLPFLTVNGKKIGQSQAINRYLAKEFGMMGSDKIEEAQIDQLTETIRDIKDVYFKASRTQGEEEKKKAVAKFYKEELPQWMAKTCKSIPAGPGPWLVGPKMSLADLQWYYFLASPKGFFNDEDGAKAAYQDCPRMKAAMEATGENPELKAWIAERPDSPM